MLTSSIKPCANNQHHTYTIMYIDFKEKEMQVAKGCPWKSFFSFLSFFSFFSFLPTGKFTLQPFFAHRFAGESVQPRPDRHRPSFWTWRSKSNISTGKQSGKLKRCQSQQYPPRAIIYHLLPTKGETELFT